MNSLNLAFSTSNYLFMKHYDENNGKVDVQGNLYFYRKVYNAYFHLQFQCSTIFVHSV